jgi:hypothetical protein
MMTRRVTLIASFALTLLGCDKNKSTVPPPDDAPPPGASNGGEGSDPGGSSEPGAPDVAWKDKTFQQRKEFMGIEVFPKTKQAFQGYDSAQFKAFKCDTCHGPNPAEKNYAMPTDAIYPLPPDDPVKAAMAYDEKMTKFMVETVVPQMAEMLQMQPGTEFGCMNCHPAE